MILALLARGLSYSTGAAMTKNSLIFAVAFVASISMAGAAFAQTSPFEGFYIGGQGGYSVIDVEVSGALVGSGDGEGFGGGGFTGYGVINGPYYVAVEADVGFDGADWSATSGGITADVEAQLTYGASFHIGYVIADDLLLYTRLGWARTNFEARVAGIGSDDADLDGFRFGGGVEGMLADNIGVRGEYTYTIYDDPFDFSGVEIDLDQHLFRVGVAYYF